MKSIDWRNVTFVVQGPLAGDPAAGEPITVRTLKSLRANFPGAPVVVSTWKDARSREALAPWCDEFIASDDPGGWKAPPPHRSNVNRQIHSTRAGLRRVRTEFAVKLRSDCCLSHGGFAETWFEREPTFESEFFSGPIVASTFFFRDPGELPILFHPSDLFHFGRAADLLDLWDVPDAPREETEGWRAGEPVPPEFGQLELPFIRYAPEQHLWIRFLAKRGHAVELEHQLALPLDQLELSERSLFRSFYWRDFNLLGLTFPERMVRGGLIWSTYSEHESARLRALYAAGDANARRARREEVEWKYGRWRRRIRLRQNAERLAGGVRRVRDHFR